MFAQAWWNDELGEMHISWQYALPVGNYLVGKFKNVSRSPTFEFDH